MKKNIGNLDKTIRIIIGIVILALGVYFRSWWGLIGILPILTAIVGWCWLYALIGTSTDKSKAPQQG